MSVTGHFYTVWPAARHALAPGRPPLAAPFSLHVQDPKAGDVRLDALYRRVPNAISLVVVLHGLGGRADSAYCSRAAAAAERLRVSCLRLWARGSDRRGEDLGHAGLTNDLHELLRHRSLREYRRIYLLGYSIGGHLALKLAVETEDPRVKAVAAVCPPLDLALSAAAFDERVPWPYRHHVLRGLKEIYSEIAWRRPVPTPVEEVERVRTIQDWDRLTVVPRHGFADVAEYYSTQSVAPTLGNLRRPALVVATEDDPMVPADVIRGPLEAHARRLDVRWVRGGHVGFPSGLDLGLPGPRGLENQVLGWLHAQQREADECARESDVSESREPSRSSSVLLLD